MSARRQGRASVTVSGTAFARPRENDCGEYQQQMVTWQFFQGLRAEWRWYRFDEHGDVVAESDQAFAELKGCMANAEAVGFRGESYQVHARQSGFVNADAWLDDPQPDAVIAARGTSDQPSG